MLNILLYLRLADTIIGVSLIIIFAIENNADVQWFVNWLSGKQFIYGIRVLNRLMSNNKLLVVKFCNSFMRK